ncbi:MAG: 2OG-Fe(II) oxygenase [Burkholderiaceae bacterium]|nr:2OG-Fe(II) oxygenase [Burkholderiaceae bacterium]MEB2319980.1 2OG-Fe(II) oxygenase [Pseudomonadota bacterium]
MDVAQMQAKLGPQWQDWLAENIARGCRDEDLVRVMTGNGFDPVFASSAVAVVAAMTARVRAQAPAALVPFAADPIRLPAGSRAMAHDREVGFGFVLRSPNIAVLENLLDEDECRELIRLSAGKLKRSEVVNREGGGFTVSDVRTSEGTYFARGENPIVSLLEARICALTGVPVEHGEPLQILHYDKAGEYRPHHDYFDPSHPGSEEVLARGGQRIATLVMFLNDVPGGGATEFPEIELTVMPRRGCAVYFEYCNRAGDLDSRCLHAGRPVTAGEKWVVTKWLRQRPY